jgi:hypothetical protein
MNLGERIGAAVVGELRDRLTEEYDALVDLMDETTDLFDDESTGIKDLRRYIERNMKKVQARLDDEKYQAKMALRKVLLQRLNDPYLDFQEVELVSGRLELSPNQVRDFLRNQRKRILFPMNGRLDRDFTSILKRTGDVDEFIVNYLGELTKREPEIPSSPLLTHDT